MDKGPKLLEQCRTRDDLRHQMDKMFGEKPQPAPPRNTGPGTHLKLIFQSLGINPDGCGGCPVTIQKMNAGTDWCNDHFDELVAEIKERAKARGWLTHAKAAAKAIPTGLAFKVNWKDPIPGLVREAIKRAKEEPG